MMLLLWRTNSYIEITTTVHIIRHSVMADTIMAIVHIMAVMVTIMGLIITDIIEMSTIMHVRLPEDEAYCLWNSQEPYLQ